MRPLGERCRHRLRSDRNAGLECQGLDRQGARQETRKIVGTEELVDQIGQHQGLGQRSLQDPQRYRQRAVVGDTHVRGDRTDDELADHGAGIHGLAGLTIAAVGRAGGKIEH